MTIDTRSYGASYSKTTTVKEIAAIVRGKIRDESKAGTLPRGKYSVRYRTFAGGSSIDIRFAPDAADVGDYMNTKWIDRMASDPHSYTEECRYSTFARAVTARLEGMLRSHNHDGSDTQTDYYDVKFYGHADLDIDYEALIVPMIERRRDARATGDDSTPPQPVSLHARTVVDTARKGVRKIVVKPVGTTSAWSIEATPVCQLLAADPEVARVLETWFDSSGEAHDAARDLFPCALIAVR